MTRPRHHRTGLHAMTVLAGGLPTGSRHSRAGSSPDFRVALSWPARTVTDRNEIQDGRGVERDRPGSQFRHR